MPTLDLSANYWRATSMLGSAHGWRCGSAHRRRVFDQTWKPDDVVRSSRRHGIGRELKMAEMSRLSASTLLCVAVLSGSVHAQSASNGKDPFHETPVMQTRIGELKFENGYPS